MKATLTLITTLILLSTALSQTTYRWTGSVNSNFSTAGNWEPFRQVGLTSDILKFDNGNTLNIQNVYQVTVGQIVISNYTNVILTPADGNNKTISIQGNSGEDLIIESGSSLTISGNDPKLNIFLKAGATASVSGIITFTGNIEHNINTNDVSSFRFKNGSVLNQFCPGNIFTTTGVNNSVIFESGSTFRMNNSEALNPFGLTTPNSKVLFEEGSNFIVSSCSQSALSFNGRNYPNLTIESGNFSISENFTNDVSLGNVKILQSASLTFENNNNNLNPNLNLIGNLDVNGTFGVSHNSRNGFNLKFARTAETQNISGSGVIIFPKVLRTIEISSIVSLHRNIDIYCSVLLTSGTIETNNFILNIYGKLRTSSNLTNNSQLSQNQNDELTSIPNSYSLSQNYPNPFNPGTKLNYTIPVESKVTIQVFDISGRQVNLLAENENRNAGTYTFEFTGNNLSSGIYFLKLSASSLKDSKSFNKTIKMTLVK